MHAIFMIYGIKSSVEHTLMDMQAQKFPLKFTKEGCEDKTLWIQGSLRLLPFGVYEYCFPKESSDVVLNTLGFDKVDGRYDFGKVRLAILRNILKCKKASKFVSNEKLLWVMNDVAIMPIGIREDGTFTERDGSFEGYTHEAI